MREKKCGNLKILSNFKTSKSSVGPNDMSLRMKEMKLELFIYTGCEEHFLSY